MNRIFKLEIKRAFRNRLFAATLCVAFAICVWHFMENVWIWRMYVYSDTYPLSAYEKWIGADNASVQPLLALSDNACFVCHTVWQKLLF